MAGQWIDFREAKAEASFEAVLDHYSIEYKFNSKGEAKVRCPFHKNGEENNPSCTINRTKKVFQCFSCGSKGNVLDFVRMKEKVTLRRAGEILVGFSGTEDSSKPKTAPKKTKTSENEDPSEEGVETAREGKIDWQFEIGDQDNFQLTISPAKRFSTNGYHTITEGVNDPLDFKLTLNPKAQMLEERGVSEEIAQEYGIGLAKRGVMKDRICFPIHNSQGELVAYAGRWANDVIPDDKPEWTEKRTPEGVTRYLFPEGFNKSLEMFLFFQHFEEENHQEPEPLILVEGFWTALQLSVLGLKAVALMGWSLSESSLYRIAKNHKKISKVVVMLDDDDAGNKATPNVISDVSQFIPTMRYTWLPIGRGNGNDITEEDCEAVYALAHNQFVVE